MRASACLLSVLLFTFLFAAPQRHIEENEFNEQKEKVTPVRLLLLPKPNETQKGK